MSDIATMCRAPTEPTAADVAWRAQPRRRQLLRAGARLGLVAPWAARLAAASLAAVPAMAGATAESTKAGAPPDRRSASPASLARTPSSMEGPFYPDPPPTGASHRLVSMDAQGNWLAVGTPMRLQGRILDTSGQPLAGAMIEIWQLNGHGRYHHPGDRRDRPHDPGFAGYGRMQVGAQGDYSFLTIRPGWEETRILGLPINLPPHVHVKIAAPGQQPLTTELHLPPTDEPKRLRWLDRFAPFKPALSPALSQDGLVTVARFDFVL